MRLRKNAPNKTMLFSQQAGLGLALAGFANALALAPNCKRYVSRGGKGTVE